MNALVDNHWHTNLSVDARDSLDDMVARAIELNLREVTVTDHLDMNPADEGYGMYDADRAFADIERVRNTVGDRITLHAGVEIGEPHLYADQLADIYRRPYDLVIGSVHYVGTHGVHLDLFDVMSVEDAIAAYFDVQLNIIRSGTADVIAHFDYFLRYTRKRNIPDYDPLTWKPTIQTILREIISSDACLEVNTSGLRQGIGCMFPDAQILDWYRQLGGTRVSLGSDAHFTRDLAADIDHAMTILGQVGLTGYCTFQGRTPIWHDLST